MITKPRGAWFFVVMAMLVAGVFYCVSPSAGENPRIVAAPAVDETPAFSSEVAVLAGGCFWGVQGVFQHVNGVISAISGYAGGARDTARYEMTSTGTTGHAEAVEITFDPRRITYGHILQIFFSVVHDPTQLNRQGPDSGTQYRSAIFRQTADQARIAAAYIEQLNAAKAFASPIVTTVELHKKFYPAEAYHQNYLTLHPHQPYIVINDMPKVEALKQLFPDRYRAEPVLVGTTQSMKTEP